LPYAVAVVSKPYSTSDEWRRALSVAEAVKLTARDLQLEPRTEWLRQVMNEAADQMRAAVLWAASQGSPSGKSPEALRPLVVAADAARSDAALASYFLSFLSHEKLVTKEAADSLASQLLQVEAGMNALSSNLRGDLGFDPYGAEAAI
jgi:hypothetical protein